MDPIKAREHSRNWKARNRETVREGQKRYYLKNKEVIDAKHADYVLQGGNLRRYGLTLDRYNQLHDKQFGCCAICKEVETNKHANGKVKKLSVDHNHKTGEVRGLLCSSCNRGIGYLRDNSALALQAYIYLKAYGN